MSVPERWRPWPVRQAKRAFGSLVYCFVCLYINSNIFLILTSPYQEVIWSFNPPKLRKKAVSYQKPSLHATGVVVDTKINNSPSPYTPKPLKAIQSCSQLTLSICLLSPSTLWLAVVLCYWSLWAVAALCIPHRVPNVVQTLPGPEARTKLHQTTSATRPLAGNLGAATTRGYKACLWWGGWRMLTMAWRVMGFPHI